MPLTITSSTLASMLPTRSMVALTGAGGKTSLMYALAHTSPHRRIMCSTTTKLWAPAPENPPLHLTDDLPALIVPATSFCWTVAQGYLETPSRPALASSMNSPMVSADSANALPIANHTRRKIYGFTPDAFDRFWCHNTVDLLLIEADGAAGRLVKAPANKEPVIPATTDTVIGVINLTCLGKPITEQIVWRIQEFCQVTQSQPADSITIPVLMRVITSSSGIFKNCPKPAQRILFLNGSDIPGAKQHGIALAEQLFALNGYSLDRIYIGAAQHAQQECTCITRV